MFSRSISRRLLESPWRVPPVFLLPLRAAVHTTPQFVESNPPPTSSPRPDLSTVPDGLQKAIRTPPQQQTSQPQSIPSTASSGNSAPSSSTELSVEQVSSPPTPLSESVKELLPALVAQPPHYATLHIHARAYLVTEGDVLRLPFRMPGVEPGDILRLNRASLLGSREFTLRGQPYVEEQLFECRAVVLGVEAEPMRFKEKTKRRNRRVKTVRSKHRYTELAIKELRVKSLDEHEQ